MLTIIQQWFHVLGFFQKITLRSLGLRVQLGDHSPGIACPYRENVPDFVIVDVSGVHTVSLDFCGCQGTYGPDKCAQLLRMRLYPSKSQDPSTAFTLQVLRDYLSLSFNTRLSHQHYFKFLQEKMDNTGLRDIPVKFFIHCQNLFS